MPGGQVSGKPGPREDAVPASSGMATSVTPMPDFTTALDRIQAEGRMDTHLTGVGSLDALSGQ